MKNVVIISTSQRKNGNSDFLAQTFMVGAKEAGHQVEFMSLAQREIKFCKGCLVCQKTKKCVIHDDVKEILEKMKKANVIVFATPIYFYEMCGQMKTLLDRSNPLFHDHYHFQDIYLLATAADQDESAMSGVRKGLEGWIECFEKARLKGIIRGIGIDQYGDVKNHQDILKQTYEMGKTIES